VGSKKGYFQSFSTFCKANYATKTYLNAKKAPGQLRQMAINVLILLIKFLVGAARFELTTPTPPV
jgi:hypothetical protein